MTVMSKYQQAKDVLEKAREEILRELTLCGQNGGTGRSQNYAPILVNLHNAIKVIEELDQDAKSDFGERMKAARAAKASAAKD
jgi:hypothetical protein